MNKDKSVAAVTIALFLRLLVAADLPADDEVRFDTSDVAILWPVPTTPADLENLISAGERLRSNMDSLWPQDAFDQLTSRALATQVEASSGAPMRISFNEFDAQFKDVDTWHVASLRLDPSAPGTHAESVRIFGSKPQIRLVVQPVTIQNGRVRVHDFSAHLVFDFVDGFLPPIRPDLPPRSIPNKDAFSAVIEDFKKLKLNLGVDTAGQLGIHPGIQRNATEFNDKIRAILRTHLGKSEMTTMAFMGIKRPEPWIFFGLRKVSGEFKPLRHPSLGGHSAQMFSRRGGSPVMPNPKNRNLGTAGVATASLLTRASPVPLTQRLFAESTDPRLATIRASDIPDIIENPLLSNVATTDCVSCHTASSLRSSLAISRGAFAFPLPAAISGVQQDLLPGGGANWNVRSFGWGHPIGGDPVATITMRTANEAAESADFINREYLTRTAKSVSNPLTLVTEIKSEEDLRQLKAILVEMNNHPPAENPVLRALDNLGMVHFARFVILEEEMKFAVITSYDGALDVYVQAFADEIGEIFDQINKHIKDAPPTPVSEHPVEFMEFIEKHNRPILGTFYSAYPNLSTQDVLTLKRDSER